MMENWNRPRPPPYKSLLLS